MPASDAAATPLDRERPQLSIVVPAFNEAAGLAAFWTRLSLGVIGEYLGRVYDEVKARPLYIVRRRIGFDADESGG